MAIFGGYVMSTLPKLREMLGGLQVDVRAKIWLRRVEGFSFWGVGPQTGSSFIFGGYVISTLPKFREMLVGLPVDLLAKRGPLSAVRVALRRGQKNS